MNCQAGKAGNAESIIFSTCVHAQALQSCLTLCDPMDCSLPGSSVHGVLQARILEWVAMPSSKGSSQPRNRTYVSSTAGRFFTHWATWETLQPHGLYGPWNSSGQNTGVGSLSLLQGIFPTQGSNPGLPHCRWILYQLNHKGCPRILEWVAYPFSRGSSWPRNQTGVSCIAGRFFTNWAIREAYIQHTAGICSAPTDDGSSQDTIMFIPGLPLLWASYQSPVIPGAPSSSFCSSHFPAPGSLHFLVSASIWY